jgi:hypothetical protein
LFNSVKERKELKRVFMAFLRQGLAKDYKRREMINLNGLGNYKEHVKCKNKEKGLLRNYGS